VHRPPDGLAKVHHPVGRPITRAAVAFGIDEGLEEIDGVPVDPFPVRRDSSRHLTENVRRQMRDTDPRQNERARIIGEKADITAPRLCRPADKAVAGAQMPRRRRPGQAGDRASRRIHQIFEVFPHLCSVKKVWRTTLRRAKVPYFSLYELRHTFPTRLSTGGVADHFVTLMLRQGDAGVLKRYSQAKLNMMREALGKLHRTANERSAISSTVTSN
jgi:integrase